MKDIFRYSFLIFLTMLVFNGVSSAQPEEVLITKQKAKTTIKPKAKPQPKKIDVSKSVTIVRVEKKSRTNYQKPRKTTSTSKSSVASSAKSSSKKSSVGNKTSTAKKTEKLVDIRKSQAPLLSIDLRLLKVKSDGTDVEVNPLAAFSEKDRLRFAIRANQAGFLYIIRQTSPEQDGEIIFPNSLVNNGSNAILPNYDYVFPFNCPKDFSKDLRECSLKLFKYKEAPQEYFTVIFSRDSLIDLPNSVKKERVSVQNIMSGGKVAAKILIDLIEESGQDLVSQIGGTPFSVRLINQNANDNEEIIETFVVSKMNN